MSNSQKGGKNIKKFSGFGNEPGSFITHVVGFGFSILALVLLIIKAAREGNAWHVTSFTIFGVTLILMYAASSIYHIFSEKSKVKRYLQVVDHAIIYLLIAGTYTPIYLVVLNGGWGWALFGVTWGIAIFGLIMKFFFMKKLNRWFSTSLYLVLGWLGVISITEMLKNLSQEALYWLFLGGILYTIGTIFFGLGQVWNKRGWFGFHEIFHVFILLASFCHFWLMFNYVAYL